MAWAIGNSVRSTAALLLLDLIFLIEEAREAEMLDGPESNVIFLHSEVHDEAIKDKGTSTRAEATLLSGPPNSFVLELPLAFVASEEYYLSRRHRAPCLTDKATPSS